MSFEQQIFIPFHLVDAAGILFYSHVFTLSHQTYEAYVEKSLKMPWKDWFHHPDWIIPIKQTEAFYTHSIKAGEVCNIQFAITEMRSSSFTSTAHFVQNCIPCCAVKTVHVFCERHTGKKRAIPESIQALIKANNSDLSTFANGERGMNGTR